MAGQIQSPTGTLASTSTLPNFTENRPAVETRADCTGLSAIRALDEEQEGGRDSITCLRMTVHNVIYKQHEVSTWIRPEALVQHGREVGVERPKGNSSNEHGRRSRADCCYLNAQRASGIGFYNFGESMTQTKAHDCRPT